MLMQVYWLPWSEIAQSNDNQPRPAQFVFTNNEDRSVRGFVSEVDVILRRFQICLFEATDLDIPAAELVYERINNEDVSRMLRDAFAANPAMAREWDRLIKNDSAYWNN